LRIIFSANGGAWEHDEVFRQQWANVGTTFAAAMTAVGTPIRTNYTFVGWFTQPQGGVQRLPGHHITSGGEIVLYAHWRGANQPDPVAQTIILRGNGGIPAEQTVTAGFGSYYGAAFDRATEPTRAGWNFIGWYTQETGGVRVLPTDRVSAGGTLTLWAQWESEEETQAGRQTVTFLAGEGQWENGDRRREVTIPIANTTYAAAFTLLGDLPTREGWRFVGWFDHWLTGAEVTATTPITNAPSRVLWARWVLEVPEEIDPHINFLIGHQGNIRPNANITRAEVATIFFRLIEDDVRAEYWTQTNSFTDVQRENWFNNAISTMMEMGWLEGVVGSDSTLFDPNRPATRAELAAIMYRLVDETYDGENLFTDIDGHWAEDYINAVGSFGWFEGPRGLTNAFRPDNQITRAEVAAAIVRALDRVPESVEVLHEDRLTWSDKNLGSWHYLYLAVASNAHNEDWSELLENRPWHRLERPTSRPEHING